MSEIAKVNERIIQGFVVELSRRGLTDRRKGKYLSVIRKLAKYGRLDKLKKEHIDDFFFYVSNGNLSGDTKKTYWSCFRIFVKWANPSIRFDDYKLRVKRIVKMPEDVLTIREVEKILKAAETIRNRAMLSLLYDVGCRPHELLGLKRRHVTIEKHNLTISLNGKTGPRRIPIITTTNSIRYLTDWLECTETKNLDDLLFGNVCIEWLNKLVKRYGRKAGIEKRVYPYLFRHSRATHLASHLTESQMKVYFGWVQGSEMASVYVHMSGRDLKGKVNELNEKLPKEAEDLPKGELLQKMFLLAEENELLKQRLGILEKKVFEDDAKSHA